MNMSGDQLIAASRETVWAALHDPDILQASIPGCESIEKISDTEMKAVTAVKVGTVEARFIGKFLLSDLNPPNGYSILAEGTDNTGAPASAGGTVNLTTEEGGTKLAYNLNAKVGAQISELGAPLINATARRMIEQFFTRFAAFVAPPAASPAAAGIASSPYHGLAEDHDHDPSNPHYFGLPLGVIIPMVIATIAVGLVLWKFL